MSKKVYVGIDEDCEMLYIAQDEQVLFSGNISDLNLNSVMEMFKRQGLEIILDRTYQWED